jgi:alkanesulfonate monooxygenase SsuD/methylene tetrahydromethanopterin reductase-like flavin-dependent oxidoreductase (luciferase family)
VHTGILMFATDYAIRIDDLAREAEARGFESLFVPEHTHIPTSRRSPFAGGAELYDTGGGVAQDAEEAARWYRLAAAQGSSGSLSTPTVRIAIETHRISRQKPVPNRCPTRMKAN